VIAQQIHAYLRAGTGDERQQIGPFLATFTPGNDHPMRNYAIPDDDADPSASDIGRLVDAYQQRGLTPRLEYVSTAAPALERALVAAGFVVEDRMPLLTCGSGQQQLVTPPAEVVVARAATDGDHRDAMVAAAEAYDEPGPPPELEAIMRRARMVEAGGMVVIARDAGDLHAVGSGLYPVPQHHVTEVAAVGTIPEFRNRGVAAAVTSCLVMTAFEGDIDRVWATAQHRHEERACVRAGFRRAEEEMIHISL
jgi:ribosomal protein S18 acetylase RimI-like enzyme